MSAYPSKITVCCISFYYFQIFQCLTLVWVQSSLPGRSSTSALCLNFAFCIRANYTQKYLNERDWSKIIFTNYLRFSMRKYVSILYQSKKNKDQVGHQIFINYTNIHCIPRFCLKLWDDAERTFKYRWPYFSYTVPLFSFLLPFFSSSSLFSL